MLAASEQLSCSRLKNKIFLGELSLDGELRRVNGILPIIISAKQQGYDNIIIPYGNKEEAQYIEGLNIYAAHSLTEVYAYLSGAEELERLEIKSWNFGGEFDESQDIKYIKGQFAAKRAMEVAVAGGHNILLIGPPGAGKTMLARAVPAQTAFGGQGDYRYAFRAYGDISRKFHAYSKHEPVSVRKLRQCNSGMHLLGNANTQLSFQAQRPVDGQD